jgi:hypothetical protein
MKKTEWNSHDASSYVAADQGKGSLNYVQLMLLSFVACVACNFEILLFRTFFGAVRWH